MSQQRATYVIVHGAFGGGWAFKEVDHLLTHDGHQVYRPTLSGQGEKVHLASANIDLTSDITDIVNVILWEDLHDVVLVGHSYGGMVVTGVADRVPDRIRHLIYLDGFVPEDGECVNAIRVPVSPPWPVVNGFVIPPWIKGDEPLPHDVPHPARKFSEPIVLKNQAAARKIPTTYVLYVDKGATPQQGAFFPFYQRAQSRGWKTLILESDHNAQRSHPKELVHLLESSP